MNSYLEVLQSLNKECVILTPNRRLSLFLHQLYQALKKQAGEVCWETPVILPVSTWINERWAQYVRGTFAALPVVLNAAQEQKLWETILGASTFHHYLLQISETAHLIKSARQRLKQWLLTPDDPLFSTSEDYQALHLWIAEFEKQCHINNWLDQACIPDYVREQIISGHIVVPKVIYHAGFTDLSPQLTSIFNAASDRGTIIHAMAAETFASTIFRTSAADREDEFRLCAQWAKLQHDLDANEKIACVIPTLDTHRDRIEQLFTEVFTDKAIFNISAGKPLSQYPVIQAALELLALYKKNISCESLFYILSTPFIAGAESERIKRGKFDRALRSENFNTIDIAAEINKDENTKKINLARSCPKLANRIREFKVILEESAGISSYSHWAALFNRLLSSLGWPGERVLISEEYQVVEEWLKLLHEMTTLDLTCDPVSFHDALQTLKGMAAAKPFQPKTPGVNIQILGVLEAAGLCFDRLWICGMDDISWPSQPAPNPFIPKQLQREHGMPHASAERELNYCRSMTQQFKCSASAVIFSYSKTIDETSVQPSPLIRDIPEIVIPFSQLAQSEIIFERRCLEKMVDEQAPFLQDDESAKGGVEIIKNQALCPFKAFAESRLGARELESTLPGLRPKERGTIVHQILERCWNELKSHDRLINMPESTLHALLEEWIADALQDHACAQNKQNSFLAIEKQRLIKLINEWLQIEKLRSPFSVMKNETGAEIQLGELKIKVRIDRVDQLENGNKFIIDYKTGRNLNVSDWFGERPDAPQLPLYVHLDSVNTAGIAYAQVSAGKLGFVGVSQYDSGIKGVTASDKLRSPNTKSWNELIAEWNAVLLQLGYDFYHGKANVDPKNMKTCERCGLKPLCRIHDYNGYEANDE